MTGSTWSRLTVWGESVGASLRRRIGRRSARTERVLMVLAVVLFLGAAAFGIRNFPRGAGDLRWVPLLIGALGGVPPTLALNSLEYAAMARVVDRRVSWGRALRVTVMASAANVLPVPGAVLVRVQALAELDVPYRAAVASAGIVGGAWVSTTLLLAGVVQLLLGPPLLALVTIPVGVFGLLVTWLWLARRTGARRSWGLGVRILAVEGAFVVVSAVRMLLLLWGLGSAAGWSAAFALTIAAALASVVGFFPGGLGLRELLAAGIGPLVGLSPAVGALAAVAQRLGSFVTLGGVALVYAIRGVPLGRTTSSGVEPAGGRSDD